MYYRSLKMSYTQKPDDLLKIGPINGMEAFKMIRDIFCIMELMIFPPWVIRKYSYIHKKEYFFVLRGKVNFLV